MHAIKVFAEHMTKLLNGDEDGPKVRAAERASGRFMESCPDFIYSVYVKEKKTIGQKRAELSTGCGPYAEKLYTKGILRFCLQGLLGEKQRASLFQFLMLLEILFLPVFDGETEGDFINKWHQALTCIERDFPSSLQIYVFNLLHHLPTYVQQYGPPSNFWMFPYERYNHTLSTAITNNQHPEISAVKKIEIHWLVTMLDSAGFMEPLWCTNQAVPDCQYLSKG